MHSQDHDSRVHNDGKATFLHHKGIFDNMSSSSDNKLRDDNNMKKVVVVVGGGPAGALAAKGMADRGYDVKLMEGGPHPEKTAKNSPDSYVIALRKRGFKAVARVLFGGIELEDAYDDDEKYVVGRVQREIPHSIISYNTVRHLEEDKWMNFKGSAGLITPRKHLASGLLSLAEKAGVDVWYETKLLDIDFGERKATFGGAAGTSDDTFSVSYDLLIGADGSRSTVRKMLDESKEADDFAVERTEEDCMEYQVVTLPSSYPTKTLFPGTPETSVHVWNDPELYSACLAFPLAPPLRYESEDAGTMTLPLVFPRGKLAEFKKKDSYHLPLQSLFYDLSDEILNGVIAKQLRAGEASNGGLCVWCTSMGSPKNGVVLLGDSAHGMWPSLGQGANCALETVAVFLETLDDTSDENNNNDTTPWAKKLIEDFDQRRHKDAVAAVDLTYGSTYRRKPRENNDTSLFDKIQILVVMVLCAFSGGIVPKPALVRLMKGEDDDVSYSTMRTYHFCYERIATASIILGGFCFLGLVVAYYFYF